MHRALLWALSRAAVVLRCTFPGIEGFREDLSHLRGIAAASLLSVAVVTSGVMAAHPLVAASVPTDPDARSWT
jgi:hypothetical protein